MTEIDLTLIQPALVELGPQGQTALLPALHAAQNVYGYIPEEVASAIGSALKVPLADVFGVIDFYAMFYREPVAKTVIHVCGDPACAMAGADSVMKVMTQKVEHQRGTPRAGDTITVERSPCLGLCDYAPALLIQGQPVSRADTRSWKDLVAGKVHRPFSIVGGDLHLLTGNCGKGQITNITKYEESGGYSMLRKALAQPPSAIVDEVKAAGLVGRGGAAFPTGAKWEAVAASNSPIRYVVCNADEAEPGTFKDRVVIEDDPHRVIEGLAICGYAVGAHQGYIYIRGEYTLQYWILNAAVDEARQAGVLGKNILGSDFDFDIEIRRGAGAYICGEETALFESIEGKRGFPRVKPPFPTTFGLFGKPTVINNVETLINIPLILQLGSAGYRQFGTEKSPGPKLFCISGDVVHPGLYEVPFGVTFRHLLYDLAGGMRPGSQFQAALFGGAAGAFAVEQNLDVRLTFEDLRAAGLPLGSGVITVFDQSRDLLDILLRLGHFFADESCGKCYPCQLGTQRQYEILQRLADGRALPGDKERLLDIGWTMTDASLCGLGQTAASAVLSAMRLWPELFEFPNAVSSIGEQA
ncbi:NAD-dependent formate dehydrogenase flavoprotein subunit [Longilinea arvoryzae]|uniref:NAD-dependent formate dehydrogenase flavoprotein subunit n=1 Tax=Longilinea arvoryzae TaxID=360412 RepID=A0A0S7BKT9_9CHLR|nr:NAD(P)H-dependent oxidoreductase subunit E [Longilinea arvoryzae]GAP14298.1 NAD-dependent formate dehydrogenase flavoprotein subunit [Longilinea arvoryzae]